MIDLIGISIHNSERQLKWNLNIKCYLFKRWRQRFSRGLLCVFLTNKSICDARDHNSNNECNFHTKWKFNVIHRGQHCNIIIPWLNVSKCGTMNIRSHIYVTSNYRKPFLRSLRQNTYFQRIKVVVNLVFLCNKFNL